MKSKKFTKMIYLKLLIISLVFSFGCNHSSDHKEIKLDTENKETPVAQQKREGCIPQAKPQKEKRSFVVSCGSGCAMTYNEENINFNDNAITAKFSITMYINELEADEYTETYKFICDELGILKIVYLEGESENILESEDSVIKKELREYGKELCSRIDK